MEQNRWNLAGKKAIVTGGTKGIGKAIVEEFAALGAEVLLVARNGAEVEDFTRQLRAAGHRVHGGAFDLSGAEDRQRLMAFASAELGGLDILVNNVGTNIRKKTPEYTS